MAAMGTYVATTADHNYGPMYAASLGTKQT